MKPEHIKELRRPFHHLSVKWLPVGGLFSNNGVQNQIVLPYIDASVVIERLNSVDPAWVETTRFISGKESDPLGVSTMAVAQCELTIHGVTRSGIGQLTRAVMDDKYAKTSESDALKRAALKFGVGAYLRAMENIILPKTVSGASLFSIKKNKQGKETMGQLTKDGKKYLREKYERVVTHELIKAHYGEVTPYGEVLDLIDQQDPDEDSTTNSSELEMILLLNEYLPNPEDEESLSLKLENGSGTSRILQQKFRAASEALGWDTKTSSTVHTLIKENNISKLKTTLEEQA